MNYLDRYYSKKTNKYYEYSELKELYLKGWSLRKIQEELGVNRASLSRHLKQDGVNILGNGKNQQRRYIYNVNEDFFQVIDTEEKAYCLGFFLADGSFIENGIKFDQTEKDKCVLDYIKEVMNITSEIKTYEERQLTIGNKTYHSKKMCRLTSNHKKLQDDLKNLGIQNNKTYNFTSLKVPNHLWGDFMRGFLDGDGCITASNQSFSISYTIKNKDLVDFIVSNSKPFYDFNVFHDLNKDCYYLRIQNYQNAKKFKENVYHAGFKFCLERKLKVLNKILGN